MFISFNMITRIILFKLETVCLLYFYFCHLIFIPKFNFIYVIKLDQIIIITYYVTASSWRKLDLIVYFIEQSIARAIYTTYIMPLVTRAHVKFLKQLGHSWGASATMFLYGNLISLALTGSHRITRE